MPRVSEVFSPSLTKVPSTSLGCGLAVKQVAYGKSGFLLPALHFVLNIEVWPTGRSDPVFGCPGCVCAGRKAVLKTVYLCPFLEGQIGLYRAMVEPET